MVQERRLVLRIKEAALAADDYAGIDPITITLDVAGADFAMKTNQSPQMPADPSLRLTVSTRVSCASMSTW